MKKTGISLFIMIQILLTGCGRDLEQAKRYSEIISDCDSVIAQANFIIQDKSAKADSLLRMRNNGIKMKMPAYKLSKIDVQLTDMLTIVSKIVGVRKHLENIKLFAKIGVKVNSRFIYYKRTYVNYSTTIQVHDENILIQEITDGQSAKLFISKYLL
jgi:hypothetical protein